MLVMSHIFVIEHSWKCSHINPWGIVWFEQIWQRDVSQSLDIYKESERFSLASGRDEQDRW